MTDVGVRQLIAQLQTTPTGEGLLAGVVVIPITAAARTETAGVPNGATNVYISGTDLVLQIFSFTLQAWKEVTLS